MKKLFYLAVFMIFSSPELPCQSLAPAYQFKLETVDGQKVELESMKGKVVFLDFWASWCPPCKASIPSVSKLYEKYAGNKDVVIIGINMENRTDAKKFIAEKKMKYLNVIGNDITARSYQVRGIPTFILINRNGNIAGRWVGFSETIYNEWVDKIESALAAVIEEPKPKAPPAARKKKTLKKK